MNQAEQQSEQCEKPSACCGLSAMVEAMRPRHWVKNAFVVAPLLFSGQFVNPSSWIRCFFAVAAFCLLSSAIYLINDICDQQSDLAHPVKRNRPIASGRVSPKAAVIAAMILLAAGLALVAVVVQAAYDPAQPLRGQGLAVWTILYILLQLLYSFWLKHHAIVDVLSVAMGFVLRAMAGAAAISVPISPWLVVCTLTMCLFIALAKRRGEIAEMGAELVGKARRANCVYTKDSMEHMLTVSAAVAILTYSLYCLAPRTVKNFGSGHMIWTIPLVIYGTFRYYQLSHRSDQSDPMRVLIADRIMWLVVAIYMAMSAVIIKFGSHEAVRAILDV